MAYGIAALIVAAGSGTRATTAGSPPKQYRPIGGKSPLARAIEAFVSHPAVERVLPVIAAGDAAHYAALSQHGAKLMPPVTGGPTRQESVMAGLTALAGDPPQKVLIHDAARPFVSSQLIDRVVDALRAESAVVPALPVTDTLKRVDRGHVVGTVLREGVQAVETPQGFAFEAIMAGHRRAVTEGRFVTDDAALVEWMGMPVAVVPGDSQNIKLTTAADIVAADRRFETEKMLRIADVRVGIGIDVHAFAAGHQVMLGGVSIPHNRGVSGHSDADVVLHALTDAILGAIGDGDIGSHFPPSDPQWRGVSSDRFLADAVRRVTERGGAIAHLDVAVVTEAPRIGQYREEIRTRIAAIAGIDVGRVSVKAGSNEGLGFIGRAEGIAAYATATVRLPLDLP